MKKYKSGTKSTAQPFVEETSAPTTIGVISPNGTVGTISSDETEEAISGGYQLATPAAISANQERTQYGRGIVNELEAGGLGVLRGATLGMSDLALRAYNPEWADAAAKLKQYNPDASLSGELGSFAIPALGAIKGLGVAGKAAKGAGLLQGLISGTGDAVGGIASKIIGENFVGTIAKSAAKLAAESAIYQSAQNISEAALQDKDLTAESILANTGHAAILGAGIGALIPAAAKTAQAVANTAPVRYAASGAAKQFAKFFDPDRSLQLFTGAMKKELNPETGERFQKAVSELANDSGVSFYAPGEVALDGITGKLTKVADGGLPDQSGALERLDVIKKQAGNAIGETLKGADQAAAQQGLVLSNEAKFWTKDAQKFGDKLEKWRSTAQITDSEAQRMADVVNDVGRKINGQETLEGLHQMRMGLDARVGGKNWEKLAGEEVEIIKDLRRAVSQKIEQGLSEISDAKLIQPEAVERWKNLNRLASNLYTIEKPLASAISRSESNTNILGLRFRDIGIGAVGGGVLGGPAGIGLAMANKAMQTDKGLLFRAAVGDKIQKLAWAESLMDKSQSEIAKGLEGFLGKIDAGKAAAAGLDRVSGPIAYAAASDKEPKSRVDGQQSWFDDTRKQILAVASNPEHFAEQWGKDLQPLADHAPQTTDMVMNKQLQVYAYLANVMPKNPSMPISVANDSWKPADYQIQDFRKIVQVARAPLTILQDMKNGTVTQKQADTVRTLYPRLYDSIMTQAQVAVNKPDTKLTYSQQLRLGQLFPGIMPTMDPQFVKAMQQPSAKPEDSSSQKVRVPSGPVSFSSRNAAPSEKRLE